MPSLRNSSAFFFIAVSNLAAWNAVLVSITGFQRKFGPDILLDMTWAFFAPSIPILLLSSNFDHRLDSTFGLFRCTSARMLLSQGVITAICVVMPFQPPDNLGYRLLIGSIVLLGVASGVAFGTTYRIVSKFPGYCTVALTVGFAASGPMILVLQASLGMSDSKAAQIALYEFVAATGVIGMAG